VNGDAGEALAWLLVLGLAGLALLLGALLARERGQRRQLRGWLANPGEGAIPEGTGPWRAVFSDLQRLRKDGARAQAAVQLELARFREAVQALPAGVILLDSGGHIEWFNRAATDHLALDATRDVGTMAEQLIRQGGFHEFLANFRAGRGGEPLLLRPGTGGTQRVLSLSLYAFADGAVLVSRDVSEIVQTETIRRDFVANVSHELRTPLTVITGFLEQFASDAPPAGEQARRFLDLMTAQSARMNRLLEDLLTLSRLENDTEPPRGDMVDMPALLESLLQEARALSGGKHDIELAEATAGTLRGSSEEIRSALGNLGSNAVRYTPAGGTITLRWITDGDDRVFCVADTGIGIPAEHIPRLTERFYRVDKGRSSATGGTGLGLAIVKHVLARHGATLTIDSRMGVGSTFSARFPAGRG
jgi:two-component system phosphate regulon sensor histidine kinase PhoR